MSALVQIGLPLIVDPPRIPHFKPETGEQYRFHFDMTKCIGCKCCEVACNEQNGNPADIKWRRVGEIEAGDYPFVQRFHLSMGCNHCLDAACLKGCPVDAYRKDSITGIVLHNADTCIGCQYCTWNCPYGVPQFNEERGVVGKCDMCSSRLADNREPACVNACPQGAIEIEVINIAEWKRDFAEFANAPGMPPAEATISTTRITLPAEIQSRFEKADSHRVRPEHPHWPLVFMLVMTQMSVGALTAMWLGAGNQISTLVALAFGHIALGAATLHLGRPIHFYRALKMWKRSWLSREALAFSLFAGAATLFAFTHASWAGALTATTGLVGVLCSAFIYIVPARPAWNSWRTIAEFFLTTAFLGALLAGMTNVAIAACAMQLIVTVEKYFWLRTSEEFERRQSARLLANDLAKFFGLRLATLALCIIFPMLPLALAAEVLGRYLFFVSVVPRNMAATFLSKEAA